MALTDKLSAIGAAIREKTGKSELLTLDAMPTEIASITTGGGGEEAFNELDVARDDAVSTRDNCLNKWIDGKSFTINTPTLSRLFYSSNQLVDLSKVKIILNNTSGQPPFATFNGCSKLEKLPSITCIGTYWALTNYNNLFAYCNMLKTISTDLWDVYSELSKNTTGEIMGQQMFYCCYSLRQLPDILKMWQGKKVKNNSSCFYKGAFNCCYVLDEILNIPVLHSSSNTLTYSALGETFSNCMRAKEITFISGETASWKGQTLDLSYFVGYVSSNYKPNILNYNSGITADKEVTDDATYQALKNDADWFSVDVNYSRYNHDSAVNTINSLPDTSAYLAANGGTNTIKFKGAAGALTDGGAINTLTEAEIAVATAKGWTVSLV